MKLEIIKNISFEDVWLRLSKKEKYVCSTRSYSLDGWETFIAWNPTNIYSGKNVKDFKDFVRAEKEKNNRVFGYLSYDLGYSLFAIKPEAKNDLDLPEIFFYSFDNYIKFTKAPIPLNLYSCYFPFEGATGRFFRFLYRLTSVVGVR
jgi:anthranilate/para-aminobenzoate synthase component I